VIGLTLVALVGPVSAARPYRFSDREVQETVRRVDDRAGDFRKHLDSALKRSPLQGSRREENISDFVHQFKDATHRLRDHLDDSSRSPSDLNEVLDRASTIDQFMRRQQLDDRTEADWALLSADLGQLARMFDVRWGQERSDARGAQRRGAVTMGHPADADLAQLLYRIGNRTDEFRRRLDDEMDRVRLTGTRREDEIHKNLQEFVKATDRLQGRFNEQRANSGDVRDVVRRGQTIDRFVRRNGLGGRAERTWNALRGDLEDLAAAYRVPLRWEV
jgi:hypothetical protein